MSFWTDNQAQRWLDRNYPDCRVMRYDSGRWGLYQSIVKPLVYSLAPEDDDDFLIGNSEALVVYHVGWQQIFQVENRLLGSWIVDEIYRRDPRLMHNPGNVYYQGFVASREAEKRSAVEAEARRSSALKAWDVVKRNENTMNAIAKRLEVGDTEGACKELSLENVYRRARLANPKELRSKDFWKRVKPQRTAR